MVKLGVKGSSDKFYFKNMKDFKKFLYVFKDHWCNVPFEEPVEAKSFSEMGKYDFEAINKEPKKRAEDNLSWGFSFVRFHNIDDTEEQKKFVSQMADKIMV